MRHAILLLLAITYSSYAQKAINKETLNGLELNTPLSQYESDLRLITGEEEIYANYPNLKENVLRNISNGIREGLYGGYTFDVVNEVRASRTTFFFYKDELYKVRWFFMRDQFQNLDEIATRITRFLENKYGSGEEQIPGVLKVWKGKKKYLQSFSDESEFQIEYRDEKIHRKVERFN